MTTFDSIHPVYVTLIADYGPVGDLAFAEVQQKIWQFIPQARINPIPVPAFNTIATGFCVAQMAMSSGPKNRIVYHNCAPRKDDNKARKSNAGEGLACCWINDVLVVGVNSGYSFSFLKPHIDQLHHIPLEASGSQFRSRDDFPAVMAALHAGDKTPLGQNVKDLIPDTPEKVIAYIDGYGNLKTSIRFSEVKEHLGKQVLITLNGVKHTATLTDGSFHVQGGSLAFSAGSSGWNNDRMMELFLRGGSAEGLFGAPDIGDSFQIDFLAPTS